MGISFQGGVYDRSIGIELGFAAGQELISHRFSLYGVFFVYGSVKIIAILEYHSLKQGTLYDKMGKEFMQSEKLVTKENIMISQLIEKIKKTNAPICVGLDPMLSYVPEHVVKKSLDAYGETLEGAADAIWQFNKKIIDHTFDLIPAVKPQIAMY